MDFHVRLLFLLVILYFVLLIWHLCLAEVLLFIPLGFSDREGQILLARAWGRVTRMCAGVPTFVCLSLPVPSAQCCFSEILSLVFKA